MAKKLRGGGESTISMLVRLGDIDMGTELKFSGSPVKRGGRFAGIVTQDHTTDHVADAVNNRKGRVCSGCHIEMGSKQTFCC